MGTTGEELRPEVQALADEYFEHIRHADQLWNTARGDLETIVEWEDLSLEGLDDRRRVLATFAERARRLEVDARGMDRTVTTSVGFSARSSAELLPAWRDLGAAQGAGNLVTVLSTSVAGYPLATAEHGAQYVAKLRGLPRMLDECVAALRTTAAGGRTHTTRGLTATIAEIDGWLANSVEQDPLAAQEPPTELADDGAWRAEVHTAVRDAVRPALSGARAVLVELLPIARDDEHAGLCHLAGGEDWYRRLLWSQTSSEITPEAVHQLGLDTLGALDDEYAELGRQTFGIDDPHAVRQRLRDDPSLRYTTGEEVVAACRAVLDRAWAIAPEWFRRTPSSMCEVIAVPGGAAAYYISPPSDLSAPGKFCCNVSDPRQWSRHDLASVACHEGIPGHHLQLALVLESDLHPALRELGVGSTVEGWGLYAERLADEMGLYDTDIQRLGMVASDSLRAARLVVDTGLHAFGWSRRRALDFFGTATTLDADGCAAEIDRYIADPGQASSYLVGRVVIDELRARATSTLGGEFSLPAFHDVVLGSGSPPLDELRRIVDEWLVGAR